MSSCRTCGKELPAGATQCPDDGTAVEVSGTESTMMLEDQDLEAVPGQPGAKPQQEKRAAPDLKPGDQVAGYVIDSRVGQGGMGVVYAAHHPRIGKKVAIKVLASMFCGDPTTVERFEQEARLVNDIGHPNIVDVFQFGELPDGRSFFVMEFLEGEGLGTCLERGKLSVGEATEILDVVCDALEAAHEKGVIHRDLKSDNVFLVRERKSRKVKLLDFGLAKLAGREDGMPVVRTQSGMLMGTPAYMSPEQARAKGVDHRTDIYALGCLSFKMLTGTLPFHGDNAMDVLVQQLNQPPPSPRSLVPDVPEALARIVVKMMAKSADERPSLATVREVLALLKDPTAKSPPRRITPVTPTPVPRIRERTGAPRMWPLFVALLVLGGAGFAYFKLFRGEAKQEQVAAAPERPGPSKAAEPKPAPEAVPAPVPEPEPEPEVVFEPEPAPAATPDAAVKKRSAATLTTPPPPPTEPPKPETGVIQVVLSQPGATIEIDGNVVARDGKGGRFEVQPGSHTIVVSSPNSQPVKQTVNVGPGRTILVKIEEQPLEEPKEKPELKPDPTAPAP